MNLTDLGFSPFFEANFNKFKADGQIPLRIIRENRGEYLSLGQAGMVICELYGRLKHEAEDRSELPAVGDWVAASLLPGGRRAIISSVLPRKSAFIRKVVGKKTENQVASANMETVFIVSGLDLNFNLRRIERYLSLAFESGANPVVLLNKSDICPEAKDRQRQVESISLKTKVHILSASQNTGLEVLSEYLGPGRTVAFLGSSGVGKSTIINTLLGSDRLKVAEVIPEGSRGRHTTTFRELILLPGGGMVIDTPGMREIQVTGEEEGLRQVFSDIEELALSCRFNDCSHEVEVGCAVQHALVDGHLLQNRLDSYLKLKKEFAHQKSRQEMKASAIEKGRWKSVGKLQKEIKKQGKNLNQLQKGIKKPTKG